MKDLNYSWRDGLTEFEQIVYCMEMLITLDLSGDTYGNSWRYWWVEAHLLAEGFDALPVAGNPATLTYPHDRYPYIVTAVSKTAHTITLQALDTDGVEPQGFWNGCPVYDHTFKLPDTAKRAERTIQAKRNRAGSYQVGDVPVTLGMARYCRDFVD